MSLFKKSALLVSMCFVEMSSVGQAAEAVDDVKSLREQVSLLLKRLDKLEKKPDCSRNDSHHHGLKKAKKTKAHVHAPDDVKALKEEVFHLKSEQQMMKLAQQTSSLSQAKTVKEGIEPGTVLVPGTNTSLGLSGYVKVDAVYSGRVVSQYDDIQLGFGDAPLKGSSKWDKGADFDIYANQSRVTLKTFTPTTKGQVDTKLELDFFGRGNAPRLRIASAKWRAMENELLFGQDNSIFGGGDFDDRADFLHSGAGVGSPGSRVAQIRYTRHLSPKSWWSFAVESPNSYYMTNGTKDDVGFKTNDDQTRDLQSASRGSGSLAETMPEFMTHLRLGHDSGHYSFQGAIVPQRISKGGSFTYSKTGWGLGHAGFWSLTKADFVGYSLTYGKGLGGKKLSGGAGAALDFSKKDFFLQSTFGATAVYTHLWNDQYRSNFEAGFLRIYNQKFMKTKQTNRWVSDLHANLIYTPMKNLDLGAEYGFGQRRVEAIEDVQAKSRKAHAHRVQISAKWKF